MYLWATLWKMGDFCTLAFQYDIDPQKSGIPSTFRNAVLSGKIKKYDETWEIKMVSRIKMQKPRLYGQKPFFWKNDWFWGFTNLCMINLSEIDKNQMGNRIEDRPTCANRKIGKISIIGKIDHYWSKIDFIENRYILEKFQNC